MHTASGSVTATREIAYSVFEKYRQDIFPKITPLATLASLDWRGLCCESFDQTTVAQMNLGLDPRSCLGRTALAVAIVEEFFPSANIKCAEVSRDMFRQILLQQWGKVYSVHNPPPTTWLEELLIYEEPHSMIVVNGEQFDPLFCVYAQQAGRPVEGLSHPGIIEFPPWEEITAAKMVSEAWLDPNPNTKLKTLREANQTCPETIVVRQNLIEPLVSIGGEKDFSEASEIVRALCEESPSVRRIMVLEEVFGETCRGKHEYDNDLWSMLVSCVRRLQ